MHMPSGSVPFGAGVSRVKRPVVAVVGLFLALPFAAALSDSPAHMKADLTIEDVQVAPANPGRLRVRVANQGLSPAVETQLMRLYHRGGDVEARSAVVPMLETGERQWLVVEGGALQQEADKANNSAEFP
jgi:hypothetical protein